MANYYATIIITILIVNANQMQQPFTSPHHISRAMENFQQAAFAIILSVGYSTRKHNQQKGKNKHIIISAHLVEGT